MIIKATLNPDSTQSRNTIEVPRQTSFHTPEGVHSAVIRSVSKRFRQAGGSSVPVVRFLFSVNAPGALVDYLAKLDLKQDLNEGSELWNVICRLVGRKRLQECSGKEFDLDSLVGMQCDIEINHIRGRADEHDFPFVVVSDLMEAGSLVKPLAESNTDSINVSEGVAK